MDAKALIAALVSALAWPVAATVIALVFRGEIRGLLQFLKKFKAGPLEAEFDREVRELAQETARQSPSTGALVSPGERDKLLQLAALNPRSAIIEAWHNVEFAARRVAESRDRSLTVRELQSSSALLRALNRQEALSRDEVALFNDLRALRNQAVHLPDFSPAQDTVREYIDLALGLKASLDTRAGSTGV